MLNGSIAKFRSQLPKTKLQLPTKVLELVVEALDNREDFPTTKNEKWKYTRLAKVSKLTFEKEILRVIENVNTIANTDRIDLIFENNVLISTIPIFDGIQIKKASEIRHESWQFCTYDDHVLEINAAHAQEGLSIEIEKNVILEKKIRIIHRCNGIGTHSILHHQIVLGENAQAQIEIINEGDGNGSYQNHLLDVILHKGSRLHADKIQRVKGDVFSFSTERVIQKKDSTFSLQTISIATDFTRNDVEIYSEEEGTHSQLYGIYASHEKQHIDNHTIIHHKSPNCTSDEKYKGVMNGKSNGVFNGKVIVYKDAQKINAFQSNNTLLLSDDAQVNSKPELEIYADDVKCSHGSTTGQIDEEAIFYLRARGLSEQKARELMVQAFLKDVIDELQDQELKIQVLNHLEETLFV